MVYVVVGDLLNLRIYPRLLREIILKGSSSVVGEQTLFCQMDRIFVMSFNNIRLRMCAIQMDFQKHHVQIASIFVAGSTAPLHWHCITASPFSPE